MTFETNYKEIDVRDGLPERGTRCFVYTEDSKGQSYYKRATMFESGAWVIDDEREGVVTHWLKPIPDSILLTREQLEKIIGDAHDAGYDYRTSLLPDVIEEFGEHSAPDKQTYLSSILDKK